MACIPFGGSGPRAGPDLPEFTFITAEPPLPFPSGYSEERGGGGGQWASVLIGKTISWPR